LETIPLSQREVEYPSMLEMHDASSLESEEEVAQWRGKQPVFPSSAPSAEAVRLQRLPEEERPKDTIERVILRRGSTRTFDKTASITLAQLSTILDCATRGLPSDFLEPPGAQLNDLYLIVHSVQGLKPGTYFFRRERNTLELLKEGKFRAEAYHLGLEQKLSALDWSRSCRPTPAWTSSFSRRFETHSGRIREPRLLGRPVGGGRHRRQNVRGCVCPAHGCDRADLFRR